MKKSTITKELVEMILRGDQKAEIFGELLQLFGVKYQNLISQIMHFEYDYFREKYDPERAIKRDIICLLETYDTKGDIYQQLYKKYGHQKDSLITTVLEKDFETLKEEQNEGQKKIGLSSGIDYTAFFNLNEKLKVSNEKRYDYRTLKEFVLENKALIGEIEIKNGKLFIGAYSYEENLLLTAFNFITVLNSVFKDYFVLALSNFLSIEMIKRLEKVTNLELNSSIQNKKILLNCNQNSQSDDKIEKYLLDVYYTIDSEMISMTIVGEKYEDTA